MIFGDVSANLLERYRHQLSDAPAFDDLLEAARPIEPGAGSLRLSPDAAAGGGELFVNLGPQHTRGHAVRCIMEAVASALRDQVIQVGGGLRPDEVRCLGGGARSDLWLQIKADCLGVATRAVDCPEPTSMGAAILAEASLSGRSVATVAGKWVRPARLHMPRAQG
jgi:xylulokinase